MRKDARPGTVSLSSWFFLLTVGGLATSLAILLTGCLLKRSPQALLDQPGTFSGVLEQSEDNVILVTWDGVRPKELLSGADPFLIRRGKLEGSPWEKARPEDIAPFLLSTVKERKGLFWGDGAQGAAFPVSAPSLISLPSYQAMLTGLIQDCESNSCGVPGAETLLDRLQRELGLGFSEIGMIASWEKMDRAASQAPLNKRPFLVNAGFEEFPVRVRDNVHSAIERKQEEDRPIWGGSRKDRYTMEHALHFIEKNEPRFLMISLGDADEWGHHSADHPECYANYLESIRQSDQWLRELTALLGKMGDYGRRTTIIATTDHGRGEGKDFDHHDRSTPGSEKAWAWIWGHRLDSSVNRTVAMTGDRLPSAPASHLDLRPTIERWLGLAPMTCRECGRIMTF